MPSVPAAASSSELGSTGSEFGTSEIASGSGLIGSFTGGNPPPVDFSEPSIGVFGSGGGGAQSQQPSLKKAPHG